MKNICVAFAKITLFYFVFVSGYIVATAQSALPDSLFESVSQFDPAHARTGNNVLKTNGVVGSKIKYQKLFSVKAGQQIVTETYAYYEKKRSKKLFETLLGATGGIVALQTQQPLYQSNPGEFSKKRESFPFVGVGITVAPNIFKSIFRSTPEAAIQCNFYNRDSSFVESVTQIITKQAQDQWESLYLNKVAKEDGFVEITLINKSKKDVWFDDLTIAIIFSDQLNATGPITNNYPDDPSTTNRYRVYVRSFAPPGSFSNYGFADDNRGFSISETVTSRVRQEYVVIPDGVDGSVAGGVPRSDPTIKISTGESRTGTPRGQAVLTSKTRANNANTARVYTTYEGSNPFYDPFAPDIEVETRITVSEDLNKTRLTLAVQANSKRFPALEIFIEDLDGNKVFLAVEGAYGGPGDLITRSKTYSTITADVSIKINSTGTFQSVYRTGSVSQLYSIQSWNQQFTSQNAGPF